MTIVNVNYASLDEVFGSDFCKTKKERKKKLKQPSCNYYARKYDENVEKLKNYPGHDAVNNYSNYSMNNDLEDEVNKDNRYSEKKRRAQQKYQLYVDNEEELDYFDRIYKEHEFKGLQSNDGNNIMNYKGEIEEDDEIEEPLLRRPIKTDTLGRPNKMVLRRRYPSLKQDFDTYYDNRYEYVQDKNYLDFGLYLISGILLIFIMEQFVQIGMNMKKKNMEADNKLYVF